MKIEGLALCAIVVALIGAEIAHPTTFHSKRVSHASMLGITATPTLDQAALDDLPPIVTPALGNIDAVYVIESGRTTSLAPGASVPRDATLRIVGWGADRQALAPGFMLLAIVDGKRRIDVTSGYRIPRPDVAAFFKAPALRDTGFTFDLPAAALGPGPRDLRMAVVTADGRAVSEFPTVVRLSTRGNTAPSSDPSGVPRS